MDRLAPLFNWMEGYVALTDELKAYLVNIMDVRLFKKDDHILREGEVTDGHYFIASGLVRIYHVIDGKDHTISFCEENNIVRSWKSFLKQEPARHNIQCLEDCQFLIFPRDRDKELRQKFTEMTQLGRLIVREELQFLDRTVVSLLIHDSKKRYIDFINRYPHLTQRIPQYQLATYLGMRPETLSRIRKELSNHYIL